MSWFSSKSASLDWLIRVEVLLVVAGLCVLAWKLWLAPSAGAGENATPPRSAGTAENAEIPSAANPAARRRPTGPSGSTLLPVSPPDAPALPSLSDPRVLVEKAGRRLTVYDGDRPVKAYRVDVGRSPGDKHREGDMRTPEGTFYICVHNEHSKYTRSLGLSYPNIEDARRGLRDGLITRAQYNRIVEAIRDGRQPPWNTPLGGEIMIHGNSRNQPGKEWTAGCVGLIDNHHILELFRRLPSGTRVVIRP
jgi:lipoprotein-anchoring transpeptidase ErfK/SrfK